MKLQMFIEELIKISAQVKNSNNVEVKMADYIPVVKPLLFKEEGIVFITDVDPANPESL